MNLKFLESKKEMESSFFLFLTFSKLKSEGWTEAECS